MSWYLIEFSRIGKTHLILSYAIGFIFYITLSVLFFNDYPTTDICMDVISYLSIAEKYSTGHFTEALNAYWSPLISWLIIPFYWINIDPFIAFRIINFVVGLGILALTIKIFDNVNLNFLSRIFCFFTLCIFSFLYQTISISPDFLSIFTFFVYVYAVSSANRFSDKFYFLKVGLAGTLAFFAKGYFLVFFIFHIALFCIWDFICHKEKRRTIWLNFIKAITLFFFLIGIWSVLLSIKYKKFVISSSGSYNISLIVEGKDISEKSHYFGNRLLPPPDQYAVFSWEDPTYYPINQRNPFKSKESFLFQLKVIQYNLKILSYYFRWFSYFGLGILLILIYVPIFSRRKSKFIINVFIFSSILYLIGYSMILYEDRYTFPVFFIFIICTFYVLDDIWQYYNLPGLLALSLLICMSISFLKNPWSVAKDMGPHVDEHEYYRKAAIRLKNTDWLKGKKFASTKYEMEVSSLIAFLNKAYSYGCLNEGDSEGQQIKSLQENKIDYLFYFKCFRPYTNSRCSTNLPFYLKDKPIVYEDIELKLLVFKLR